VSLVSVLSSRTSGQEWLLLPCVLPRKGTQWAEFEAA
jgi:hypothetical protein